MELSDKILVIEDDDEQRFALMEVLSSVGQVFSAVDAQQAIAMLKNLSPSVVITDLVLPGDMNGLSMLQWLNENMPDTPVILITGYATVETALEAMKSGAYDYLVKPIDIKRLRALTHKALERYRIASERSRLLSVIESESSLCGLVGVSKPMRDVFRKIKAVAQMTTTVLLTGESGTGKELAAEAIHKLSMRKGSLVNVNCSAIPEALLESELFGYEKGAFTGALKSKPGKFDLADKGTLFLDEIGEMAISLQAKLLRTIESNEVEPLGALKPHPVDVRIIAATNQNLQELIAQGKFRQDLYYRLCVFTIRMPSLRERKEDIPILISHFLRQLSMKFSRKLTGLSQRAMKAMQEYPWQGNVRQLRNAIEEMAIISTDEILDKLPDWMEKKEVQHIGRVATMEQLEKQAIESALLETGGNKSRAAKILGIGLRTLYRKMKKYGIEK